MPGLTTPALPSATTLSVTRAAVAAPATGLGNRGVFIAATPITRPSPSKTLPARAAAIVGASPSIVAAPGDHDLSSALLSVSRFGEAAEVIRERFIAATPATATSRFIVLLDAWQRLVEALTDHPVGVSPGMLGYGEIYGERPVRQSVRIAHAWRVVEAPTDHPVRVNPGMLGFGETYGERPGARSIHDPVDTRALNIAARLPELGRAMFRYLLRSL